MMRTLVPSWLFLSFLWHRPRPVHSRVAAAVQLDIRNQRGFQQIVFLDSKVSVKLGLRKFLGVGEVRNEVLNHRIGGTHCDNSDSSGRPGHCGSRRPGLVRPRLLPPRRMRPRGFRNGILAIGCEKATASIWISRCLPNSTRQWRCNRTAM